MDYNYHTHTYRCSHAVGTPEEYIERAIECGIKYMGFSDHIPLKFDDGFESLYYRVPESDGLDYINEIKALAHKYKDKIEISVGFESEYYPDSFEKMLDYAKNVGAEYLIMGEHFCREENTGRPWHTVIATDDISMLKMYTDTVVEGIKTGAFTYVAHPDIVNFTGERETFINEYRKICVAAREYNTPLEINFLGIRENRSYPKDFLWKVAGEEKAPVTFGFDSHEAQNAYDGESLVKALEMVEKYNLNYIGKPVLKKLL